MSTAQQPHREPNPYEYIEYFTESRQFKVAIPKARYQPIFDTLQEAMEARDRMLQSPHFPQAQRYEPRKEFATYADPNLETRTY